MTGAGSALGGVEASGTGDAAGAATGAATGAAAGAGDVNESEQRDGQREKQEGIKIPSNLNDYIYQWQLYFKRENALLIHCY